MASTHTDNDTDVQEGHPGCDVRTQDRRSTVRTSLWVHTAQCWRLSLQRSPKIQVQCTRLNRSEECAGVIVSCVIFDYSTDIIPGGMIKFILSDSNAELSIWWSANSLFLDHLLSLAHRTLTVPFNGLRCMTLCQRRQELVYHVVDITFCCSAALSLEIRSCSCRRFASSA